MTICDCGSENFAVVENYNTCLECGTCHEYAPIMTFSYNHPYNSRPRAYYCRVKRFKQYVRDQNKQILFQCIDEILDLYNYVEFFWGITKGKRRYFFLLELPGVALDERPDVALHELHSKKFLGALRAPAKITPLV